MQIPMTLAQSPDSIDSGTDLPPSEDRLDELREAIEHAADLLPAQGPITVFVHHNTLHALEDLPFEEAVVLGLKTFGCQPYFSEDRYRQMLGRDRIRLKDLEAVLQKDLGPKGEQTIIGLGDRLKLRLAMLQYPIRSGSEAELRWLVAETDALRRFRPDVPFTVRDHVLEQTRHWILRDLRNGRANGRTSSSSPGTEQAKLALAELLERFGLEKIEHWSAATWEAVTLHALWRACRQGLQDLSQPEEKSIAVRPRDWLREATGVDCEHQVHELLIRFCAAFLDQGVADWPLPHKDQGFYRAFLDLYGQSGGPQLPWMKASVGSCGGSVTSACRLWSRSRNLSNCWAFRTLSARLFCARLCWRSKVGRE